MAMMLSKKLARLGALTKMNGSSSSVSKSRSSKSVPKSLLLMADRGIRDIVDLRWYVADVDDDRGGGGGSRRDKMGEVKNQYEYPYISREPNQKLRLRRRLLRPLWNSGTPSLGSCYGVIDKNLYSIGGGGPRRSYPSSDAYMVDMTSYAAAPELKSKWEKIPCNMGNKRVGAQAVVVDEKLYVFGGTYERPPQATIPWAEVYDPKNQQWTPLSEPPTFLPQLGLFAAYDEHDSNKKKMIVLGCFSSTYLLAYNVMDDAWEIIAHDFETFTDVTLPVLYDNRLYWVADRVAIYDLHLKRMFEGPIRGYFSQDLLECPRDVSYKPLLLHIHADQFLFIWLRYKKICCTSLQIQIQTEKEKSSSPALCYYPIAHSLSTQEYLVDHPIRFVRGLLLDRTSSFISAVKEKLKETASLEIGEVNLPDDFGQGSDGNAGEY